MKITEYYTSDNKQVTLLLPDSLSEDDITELEDKIEIIIKQYKRKLKK